MEPMDEKCESYVGYTFRIPMESMNKLHYIAYCNNRPLSYELRSLVTDFIDEFEQKYGEISIPRALNKRLERRRGKHGKTNPFI